MDTMNTKESKLSLHDDEYTKISMKYRTCIYGFSISFPINRSYIHNN